MRFVGIFYLYLVYIWPATAQNVLITTEHNPCEPAIMMDPRNPNVIMGAANLNNYFVSLDTGRTWSTHRLNSSYGVWGDPVIIVDTVGDFYFFHLSNPPFGSWIDRIVCQKTTDYGMNWNDGSYAGLNGSKAQDKQWVIVDQTNNHLYMTWTQFDKYGSANSADSSHILFSRSVDGGISWSPAKRINKIAGDCIDSDNTVEGAMPAVGPNREIYVTWAGPNGLVFNKSYDQGETWLPAETPVDPMPTGWDYKVPGISRSNGLPITVCDLSIGPHHGTLYVNWSDQRNGSTNTDIFLIKSSDGGDSWSAPVRVNDDDTERHQFFTWMAIDQTTGYLYFVFYDRRNYAGDSTDVYMAISTDGGNTFINRRISESPFLPTKGVFFGDYTNVTVHHGIVRPIWTRLNNGQLSIWTHLTTHEELITSARATPSSSRLFEFESYPNPTGEYFFVSYKLHDAAKVNLTLVDRNGKTVAQFLRNEKRGYGKYVERMDTKKLGLSPGLYFVKLEINGVVRTLEQVIVNE